jgi:dipeptidyl aminopeptidase/acylaminoacyl peptidase
VYEPSNGQLTRWTKSEIGGLDESAFVKAELVRYPTFDRVDGKPRQIPAFVYRPAEGKGPFPVIVQIHGGPAGQSRPSFYSDAQYWVNELGLIVIRPNVRGSSGYGKSFLKLDDGVLREESVKDIGALLDWIGTQPDMDADRVVLRGGSKNTSDYRRDHRRQEYGDERIPEIGEFLNRTAPMNNVHKISKPLLVLQGTNDPRVTASESEQIVQKVRQNEVEVWYVLYDDEGHGFRKLPNRIHSSSTVAMFLQEHLLD